MKTWIRVALAGVFLAYAPGALADETPEDALAQYEALLEEYTKAQTDAMMALRQAKPEDQAKIAGEKMPRPSDWAAKFLLIAKADPKSDGARESLSWIVASLYGGSTAHEAVDLLLANFADAEEMVDLAGSLGRSPGIPQGRLLRGIHEKSPHEDARALACLSLAQNLLATADAKGMVQGELDGDFRLQVDAVLGGDEGLAEIRAFDDAAARKEAEGLLDLVKKDYADKAHARGTFGETADQLLFELRVLGIGKTAPEISGEDIDGVAFNLSDYRGKVVMLDFWGDW